jgi:hypothetical protein
MKKWQIALEMPLCQQTEPSLTDGFLLFWTRQHLQMTVSSVTKTGRSVSERTLPEYDYR